VRASDMELEVKCCVGFWSAAGGDSDGGSD
jgi:hypothetical protein